MSFYGRHAELGGRRPSVSANRDDFWAQLAVMRLNAIEEIGEAGA